MIQKNSSPTICPLPFLHTYITADGSKVACCESQEVKLGDATEDLRTTWNNSQYKELRRQLLSGERPQICSKCWDNEDLGSPSHRQDVWRDYEAGFFGPRSLETNESLEVAELPHALELKCTNLCNLKCRMCHPESSSRIIEDREIIDKYRKDMPWSKKVLSSAVAVQDLISQGPDFLKSLEVIQFSGGEPLISEEQYALVNSLLNHEPERIHLRYATNLTQLNYKNLDYPELWKRFGRVNIKISIDGIEDVYDYIRVGSNYKRVHDNLMRLLDMQLPNVHLALGFTTQIYNAFQLPEFLNHFEKLIQRGAISTHLLHAPKMMMITSYPPEIRARLLNKLKALRTDIPHVISALENSSYEEKYWLRINQYTQEMEAKWKVEKGFRHLLEKYLDGF